jgi:DNA-binding beta-propeller fold protein YncE
MAVSAVASASTRKGSRAAPAPSLPRKSRPVAATPKTEAPIPGGLIGYVFNTKSQDVTLFDPATRDVLATKPLGAVVRWLSNEQQFWDGRHIWSYDFPENQVQIIAVDPLSVTIARTLPTGGTGPAHSLMLTPDRKTAWVNVAGGNYLAVLDLGTGEVVEEIATGKFP